jgi:predicted phosphodiesterase
MRAAVISDVHGNLVALEAVLAAIADEGVDEVWCVGDLVGYGPAPAECHDGVLDRAAVCLAGNHDLVVSGVIPLSAFAHDAAAAARWTAQALPPETLSSLASLTPAGERAGVELYHASVRDPVWEYVLDDVTAAACLRRQRAPLCLIGHSHIPLVFGAVEGQLVGGAIEGEPTLELRGGPYLLNPGSVGQPRDGDPRASFLVLDLDAASASWRRVAYDIAATQRAMHDAGLPRRLADRLAQGR